MRPAESVVRVLGQVGGAIHTSDLGRGMNTVVHWMGAATAMFADEYAANMPWARRPNRCM